MENFLSLAKKRRSCRSFIRGKNLPAKDLDKCVEAALLAPSACNSQPWKFVIIDSPAMMGTVKKATCEGAYSMNSFAVDASAFIAVISERPKIPAVIGSLVRGTDLRRIDTGIACEHIVLQAMDMGISSCILGWFDEKSLRKALRVPRGRKIELIIALGYGTGKPPGKRRLKDRERTVSRNSY
jgi:nitroreductase